MEMDKLFKLKENRTSVRREIAAGVTTFMTMAYIIAVNPSILGDAGMDPSAVLIATCLASVIGCFCMGFLANLPFALSAGMGLNAYLAYTVVRGMGISWHVALLAVFFEGLLFILMSVTNVREAIFNAIPLTLKKGVSVGIGIFIAFIGLQNAGLSVDSSTLVTITSFRENFTTHGICAMLAAIGMFITFILFVKGFKGAILLGIVITWVMGMVCQIIGLYVPDPNNGVNSLFPAAIVSLDFSALSNTFGACFHTNFHDVGILNFIMIMSSFLFVDLFDTIGTLIGVSAKANMLDENGRLPAIRPALLSDAIATTCGAVLGTSTTGTYVESSAGIAAGGRTGLTAVTTGCLFLLSCMFSPLFTAIPSFATAPALMVVGFLMFEGIKELTFSKEELTETIPAYLCIIAMPLFYSISEGISFGVISFVVINLICGKRDKITPLMYVLAGLFICKYIFL